MPPLFATLLTDALPSPYPGLRTFNEDESIYFRGRETHVARCIELLAKHRFLMVTGASGDGKSSLVFAGMVPEIRAGFFRAKYAGWAVASFRPERTPLANLAAALAGALLLRGEARTVETELEHGFSALVELYHNSARSLPANADPANRPQKRAAANLLLIVDQFEEFFTNPENLNGDTPVPTAQTVVNLLLETARLAREHELPIYIVCTMRSDYVGQCVAFAGLAEALGKSHYFVPRLTREEFKQVIKEPASLSGCEITERLTERLVYDLHDGQDQLPVLQHALYQIWRAADRGQQPLDLLHYAQVGGLGVDELPAADQPTFRAWLAALPAAYQAFYARPSLGAVLDTHAETLYAQAGEAGGPAARRVVEQAFRALTKTDGGRVVRNRVTGRQIVALVNDPKVNWLHVAALLRPFRLPGNTFIQPFVPEEEDAARPAPLPDTAVLDITHESLIRNWRRLTEWAEREAHDVATWRDLAAQAQRWAANQRRRGFLLPVGSYSYFSEWAARFRPTAAWLLRHDLTAAPAHESPGVSVLHPTAQSSLTTTETFLARSRRNLSVTLFWLKYATRRNMLRVGGALMLAVVVLGVMKWDEQRDVTVANDYLDRGVELLKSDYASVYDKTDYVIIADRLAQQSSDYSVTWDVDKWGEPHADVLLNALSDTMALDVAYRVAYATLNFDNPDRHGTSDLADRMLRYQERKLIEGTLVAEDHYADDSAGFDNYEALAKRAVWLSVQSMYYLSWRDSAVARASLSVSSAILNRYLDNVVLGRATLPHHPDPALLLAATRQLLADDKLTPRKCEALAAALSPLEKNNHARRIYTGLPIMDSDGEKPIAKVGGKFWLLSYLYARLGRIPELAVCLDSLVKADDLQRQARNSDDGGMLNFLPVLLLRSSTPLTPYAYRVLTRRLSAVAADKNAVEEPLVQLLAFPTLVRHLGRDAMSPPNLQQSKMQRLKDAYNFGCNYAAVRLTNAERNRLWLATNAVEVAELNPNYGPVAASNDRDAVRVAARADVTRARLAQARGLYYLTIGAPTASVREFGRVLAIADRWSGRAVGPMHSTSMWYGDERTQMETGPLALSTWALTRNTNYCGYPLAGYFRALLAQPALVRGSRLDRILGKEIVRYVSEATVTALDITNWYGYSAEQTSWISEWGLHAFCNADGLDSVTVRKWLHRYPADASYGWLLPYTWQMRGADDARARQVLAAVGARLQRPTAPPAPRFVSFAPGLLMRLLADASARGVTEAAAIPPLRTPYFHDDAIIQVASNLRAVPDWSREQSAAYLQPLLTTLRQLPAPYPAFCCTLVNESSPKEAEALGALLLKRGHVTADQVAYARMCGAGATESAYAASQLIPAFLKDQQELRFVNGLLHSTLYRGLRAAGTPPYDLNHPPGLESYGLTWMALGYSERIVARRGYL